MISKQRRIIGFILVLFLCFFPMELSTSTYADELEEVEKVAIFLVPHQDDELLSFGIAILDRLWNNYDVHLVLMTDGGASAARKTISTKLNKEFSRGKFVDARNKEFVRSAQILGIDEEHLHFMNFSDGEIKFKEIKMTIAKLLNKYPNAQFNSMTYLDNNSSHSKIGEGLQQMYDQGLVKEARFYMTFYQFESNLPEAYHDDYQDHFQPLLESAANVYERWQPEYEWYAVGNHSVPRLIEQIKTTKVIQWHEPGYKRESSRYNLKKTD